MSKTAYLLLTLSLAMFAAGCGAKDEKKEEKKEDSKKESSEAGQGVKIQEGGTKEVNPNDIQLGKPDGSDTKNNEQQKKPSGDDTNQKQDTQEKSQTGGGEKTDGGEKAEGGKKADTNEGVSGTDVKDDVDIPLPDISAPKVDVPKISPPVVEKKSAGEEDPASPKKEN